MLLYAHTTTYFALSNTSTKCTRDKIGASPPFVIAAKHPLRGYRIYQRDNAGVAIHIRVHVYFNESSVNDQHVLCVRSPCHCLAQGKLIGGGSDVSLLGFLHTPWLRTGLARPQPPEHVSLFFFNYFFLLF